MTLRGLLREKKAAIVERWLDESLAGYPADASSFFRRETDPFTNPVGHALREGTQVIFENLLGEMDADEICRHLHEIIRIRAVQDFTPSQAVSFVFLLKKAIRIEIDHALSDARLVTELTGIDAQVDQIALFAFDIYSRCREQISELRINEVKRSVSAVMNRLDRDVRRKTLDSAFTPDGDSWRGGVQ